MKPGLQFLLRAWDRYWFVPSSALPVAAYRIFVSIMLLQFIILILPDIGVWYAPKGIIRLESLPSLQVLVS